MLPLMHNSDHNDVFHHEIHVLKKFMSFYLHSYFFMIFNLILDNACLISLKVKNHEI